MGADAGALRTGGKSDYGSFAVRALSAGAKAEARAWHAQAGAEATTAKVEVAANSGYKVLDKTLSASASGPTTGGNAEASGETLTLSASVSAHAAEAKAGPFAARAGVKF